VRDWPVHLIAGDMPGDFFIGPFSSFCAKSRRPGCSVHEAHREEGTLEKKKKEPVEFSVFTETPLVPYLMYGVEMSTDTRNPSIRRVLPDKEAGIE
jgi:hypothetical protein